MNNRQKFELKLRADDLWKNEDGTYGNWPVQFAWMVADTLLTDANQFNVVDAAAQAGGEWMREQCVARLRNELDRTGLTQTDMGQHLGVPNSQMSRIMNMKASISLEKLLDLVYNASKLPSKVRTVVTRRNDAELGLTQGEEK